MFFFIYKMKIILQELSTTFDIDILRLDTESSIKKKIILATNHYPMYIFFSKDFMNSGRILDLYLILEEYLKIKDNKPIKRRLPDGKIIIINPKTPITSFRKTIYEIFLDNKEYFNNLLEFLDIYFFYIMDKDFSDLAFNYFNMQLTIFINELNYNEFKDNFINDRNKNLTDKNEIRIFLKDRYENFYITDAKNKQINKWFHDLKQISINDLKKYKKEIELLDSESNIYDGLSSCNIIQEIIMGQILSFKLENTNDTAGTIFDKIRLTREFPFIRYKMFTKLNTNIEDIKNESIDNISSITKIYDKERMMIHIETIENGLQIQGLFLNTNEIKEPKDLKEYIKSKGNITTLKSLGIMMEFLIENPKPSNWKENWSPFDSSVFSNLCMNENLFERFLKINDTDKISRNNHSVLVYFIDILSKDDSDSPEIYVGGWNRISSRFGDLTAILSPIKTDTKKYYIHVKITRSKTRENVIHFKEYISKIITYYNQLLPKQIKIFKQFDVDFKLYEPDIILEKNILNNIGISIEKELFGSNEYIRACQAPKPYIISASEATSLSKDQTILYPPIDYKHFKSEYYKCPDTLWKGKSYKYPGLIHLSLPNHPFGYAPCCYIESHEKHNNVINKELEFKIKNGYNSYFDKIIEYSDLITKKRSLDSAKKIIQHIGQEGKLLSSIEYFMKSINIDYEYARLGTNLWENDSLLGVLEYVNAIKNKTFMRSPKMIRNELSKIPLEIGLQQNFDITEMELRSQIITNQYLDPRRWFRILEEFFNLNIYIIIQKELSESIDSLFYPNNREFYAFPLLNEIKKRDIVFIIEHQNSITLPRYELIIMKDNLLNKIYKMPFYSEYIDLLELSFQSIIGNSIVKIQNNSSNSILFNYITRQIIDLYGKTRGFLFQSKFIGVLIDPISPLSCPILAHNNINIQLYDDSFESLIKKCNIKKIYHYCNYLIFYIKDFSHLYFIIDISNQSEKIIYKKYNSIEKISSLSFNLLSISIILNIISTNNEFMTLHYDNRLMNIILDLCLYEFSNYIDTIKDKSIKTNELIRTFINTYIVFENKHLYPLINEISPRFVNNYTNIKLYNDKQQLILLKNMQSKLEYFLKWFMITKPTAFSLYKNYKEIPSYFMLSSDFHSDKDIIQNDWIFNNQSIINSYKYGSLFYLKTLENEKTFYYYNDKQTPTSSIYIAWINNTIKEGELYYESLFHKKINEKKIIIGNKIANGDLIWPDYKSEQKSILILKNNQNKYIFLISLNDI